MLEAWQRNVDTSLTQRMEKIACRASITSKPMTLASVPSTTGVTKRRRNSGWRASSQRLSLQKALATFDYLYLSGISLAILSPTSRDQAAVFYW